MSVDNILSVIDCATRGDWADGLDWYKQANLHAVQVATLANVSMPVAAHTIAAISPQTSWSDNLKGAYAIACAYRSGQAYEDIDTSSLKAIKSNLQKAWVIMTTGNLLAIGDGPKTRAFADNITYPDSSLVVTVDSWAYRVQAGLINVTKSVKIRLAGKIYDAVAADYVEAANRLQLLPLEAQAIAWVAAHRLEGRPY